MRILTFVTIVAVATAGFAQELVTELAGPAGKYKAAAEALEKQRLEAVALASKSYVGLLDGIEKSATAKGDVNLVAAVVKEREAVVAGTLETDFPSALPKAKLQGTRKTLLMKVGQSAADFAKRRKQMDAGYLQALAALQAKAAPDSDLAKQVAAEKAALLAGAAADASGVENAKVSRGKNVVVNGDFEKIGADGKPEGWRNSERVALKAESGNSFVRFGEPTVKKDGKVVTLFVSQKLEIPVGMNRMTVSARLRTSDLVNTTTPPLLAEFRNQDGSVVGGACGYCSWTLKKKAWTTVEETKRVPEGAAIVAIVMTNGGSSSLIDFDDVEVTFK